MAAALAPGSGRRRLLAAAVTALGIAGLIAHASEYHPYFFADDAFISMRYAERLALGDGLTWTDGERVEGYSNLLWVLLLAAARRLTPDLVNAARGLGLLASALAVAAVVHAYRPRRLARVAAPLFGVTVLALSTSLAAWTVGGLEQPLLAGSLAWGLALGLPLANGSSKVPRRALPAGVALGVMVLSRSDAALLVALVTLGLWLAHRLEWRTVPLLAWLVAVPLGFWLAQLAFRVGYYGDWVPNTAHAKVAFTDARMEAGWEYVSRGGWLERAPALLAVASAAALAFRSAPRRRLVVLLVVFVGWLAYVVAMGGDNMPQRRHLVVLAVVGGFMGAELVRWGMRSRRARLPTIALAAAAALQMGAVQLDDEARLYGAAPDGWVWKGRSTGELLRRAFADDRPLVAVDAAGALPYYARLPALDMLGLTDRYLATHPPEDFGTGWVGHELGDGAYVSSRAPDIVVFGNPLGFARGVWRSGREMFAMPAFSALYRLVTLRADDGVALTAFVRVDGRVGVERDGDTIIVPGHLFASARDVARLDPRGRLGVVVPSGRAVGFALELPPARWRLDVESNMPVTWSALGAVREGETLTVAGPAARRVELQLTAPEGADVRSVRLRRSNE